jgi:Flp pilus assembly protein CpaB
MTTMGILMMAVVVGAAAAAAVLAAALGLKQTRIAPVCTLWMTSSLSDDCSNPTTT